MLESTTHDDNSHEPTVNIPLLRKMVEWVESEDAKIRAYQEQVGDFTVITADSEWNQNYWAAQSPGCGTAYCVAGKVCEMDGLVPWFGNDLGYHTTSRFLKAGFTAEDMKDRNYHEPTLDPYGPYYRPDEPVISPMAYAREKLGLTGHQASLLFDATNSAKDIRDIAEEFAGEAL